MAQKIKLPKPKLLKYEGPQIKNKEDKLSVGYCILSLILPFIGFIIYFQNIRNFPKKAKTGAAMGFIGVFIGIIIKIALGDLK